MKRIRTKFNAAMVMLAAFVLTFAGIVLIVNITINYRRGFYADIQPVLQSEQLLGCTDADSICKYLDGKWQSINSDTDKNYFIFKDGTLIKSYKSGGSLKHTDNLNLLLVGKKPKEAELFSGALDYGAITDGGFVVYVCDTMSVLHSQIGEISWLLIQALTLGVLLGAILSFIISKRLTASIRALEDGASRMADGDFSPINVPSDDEMGRLCTVLNDMGAQIQKDYDEFEREEKSRREFIANASHELKTPLTVIKSYSQTLEQMDVDDATRHKFLSIIDSEVDRMTTAVSQLLELSKLEAKTSGDAVEIDLYLMCKKIADSLEMKIKNNDISFSINGNGAIVADYQKTYTIVSNLIENAVKYTNHGGNITIDINTNRVDITNTGAGIEEDDIKHIFERFYRADKSRNRQTGGTGLGLAIAKECADSIGATITATSIPNQNTTFMVEFNG